MTTEQIETTYKQYFPELAESIERGRAKAAQLNRDALAELQRQEEERRMVWREYTINLGIPEWMCEYLDRPELGEWPYHRANRLLSLPGCSPISIQLRNGRIQTRNPFWVRVPRHVAHDDNWYVHYDLEEYADIDVAITMAASYGESWHAMSRDADIRNYNDACCAEEAARDRAEKDARRQAEPEPEPEPERSIYAVLSRIADQLGRIARELEANR